MNNEEALHLFSLKCFKNKQPPEAYMEVSNHFVNYAAGLPLAIATLTLNVNDASPSTAITEVGGEGPASYSAQAIFEVNDRAAVALRSSEAINITTSSVQPLVTLSLVKL